jgi:hypothetical protein
VFAGSNGRTSKLSGICHTNACPSCPTGSPSQASTQKNAAVRAWWRIAELLREPRRGVGTAIASSAWSRSSAARRFAGLELAAGELPVAGVRLAGGALRQQHAAIRTLEDRGGDLDN